MRRKTVISRFATLLLATLACLLLALLTPTLLSRRALDEPFSGYSVMASPRDMHVIVAPLRLSSTPGLVLSRGTLYADGNAAAGTPISRFVLDGPVLHLDASGPRAADTSPSDGSYADLGSAIVTGAIAPLLVEQLAAMGYETLTVRRGTLYVVASDGSSETIGDIQAELSGRRKGQVTARGSFALRGQRIAFDAAVTLPADKRAPARWPAKFLLKGDLLEASFDGHLDVAADLQLAGSAELSSPSLRRLARWLGVPVPSAEGLNASSIRGQINWARRILAVEDAKVSLDGNEGAGALVLNMTGERPLIDGTLAFAALDLTPYAEAVRSQSFLFDRQTATWSAFDLSFPLIRHVDADLRISAPKVALKGYGLGRGAATITVRSGRLLADIAELELLSGKASAQITANTQDLLPRYTLRGKLEGFEAGPAAAALFGAPVLTGRSTLTLDVQSAGQTPAELWRRLSGKAALSVADGGRLAFDAKALRAAARESGRPPGWGTLAKGQTVVEHMQARGLLREGVLTAELAQARAGQLAIAAAGRVDLAERTLDLQLFAKANPPADRPLKTADLVDADLVSVTGSWQEPLVRGGAGALGPGR